MSDPAPKPGIMAIDAYVGGESELDGRDQVIKLSSNEGAFGPSPKAQEAYRQAAGNLHRYPDGGAGALREAIGVRHGLDAAKIVCGAGSDELISLLCLAYAGQGDEVLYSEHGFLMYPIAAQIVGAAPVSAPEVELTSHVDSLLQRVSDNTRLLFLANPNNPTGTYLSGDEMKRLRQELRDDVILVIDAAYAEYATRDDYSPGIDLVDAAANVVMTRTFSKIYGLGGARRGWAYCPADIAGGLDHKRPQPKLAAALQHIDAGKSGADDQRIDIGSRHRSAPTPSRTLGGAPRKPSLAPLRRYPCAPWPSRIRGCGPHSCDSRSARRRL